MFKRKLPPGEVMKMPEKDKWAGQDPAEMQKLLQGFIGQKRVVVAHNSASGEWRLTLERFGYIPPRYTYRLPGGYGWEKARMADDSGKYVYAPDEFFKSKAALLKRATELVGSTAAEAAVAKVVESSWTS